MNSSKRFVSFTFGLGLMVMSTTALAHGNDHEEQVAPQEIAHERFHDREARTRQFWAEQRAKRIAVLKANMLRERREVLRRYGRSSPKWARHIRRWEQAWAEARVRERSSMISERESLRRRHESYHIEADYDLVRTDREYLDQELDRCGLDTPAVYAEELPYRRLDFQRVVRPKYLLRASITR